MLTQEQISTEALGGTEQSEGKWGKTQKICSNFQTLKMALWFLRSKVRHFGLCQSFLGQIHSQYLILLKHWKFAWLFTGLSWCNSSGLRCKLFIGMDFDQMFEQMWNHLANKKMNIMLNVTGLLSWISRNCCRITVL